MSIGYLYGCEAITSNQPEGNNIYTKTPKTQARQEVCVPPGPAADAMRSEVREVWQLRRVELSWSPVPGPPSHNFQPSLPV